MPTVNLPLAINIASRDATMGSDSKILNGYVEKLSYRADAVKRAGLLTNITMPVQSAAQLMCNYFGSLVVAIGSTLYTGNTNHSFGDSGLCDYNCGSGGVMSALHPVLFANYTYIEGIDFSARTTLATLPVDRHYMNIAAMKADRETQLLADLQEANYSSYGILTYVGTFDESQIMISPYGVLFNTLTRFTYSTTTNPMYPLPGYLYYDVSYNT